MVVNYANETLKQQYANKKISLSRQLYAETFFLQKELNFKGKKSSHFKMCGSILLQILYLHKVLLHMRKMKSSRYKKF